MAETRIRFISPEDLEALQRKGKAPIRSLEPVKSAVRHGVKGTPSRGRLGQRVLRRVG